MGMLRNRERYRSTAVLAVAAAALLLCGCRKEQAAAPPAPEVGVLRLASAPVPLELVYTARMRGEREVEVRARVSGILKKRAYQEGAAVQAGALLFLIDPAPFAAAVQSAEGRLGMQQAALLEAGQRQERAQKLFESGVSSGSERDAAAAALATATAAVKSARADLERARLDLAYTEVRAPISGITGREARSEGSLVNAGSESSLLTTIAQSDRLYVEFTMPESEARLLREALAQQPDAIRVRLRPAGSAELGESAQIEFVDARVQADTGTVAVRATLANRDAALAPGQFARARIEGLHTEAGIYVPARAVMYGAAGTFVWKLDAQNLVQFQPVKLGEGRRNLVRIEDGLAANDRIVVDGVLKVQPQAPVKPAEIALDALPAAVEP